MKKLTMFLILAAMLLSIVGLTAYAADDAAATSAWGYEVPNESDDFRLRINQSGDIIVAEMILLNQESNHALYATLSYKKPDGTVETSDIKLINAYKQNPTPCVYFCMDSNYSSYCDMFVTFIDHETLKPYVKAVNVNEHFNIKQDRYEVNGKITNVDPVDKTIEFESYDQVVDENGNIIVYPYYERQMHYIFNSEYVDADAYLMHNVDIVFAHGGRDYTVLNIKDGKYGKTLKVPADDLAYGKSTVTTSRSVVEYYDGFDATRTTKINVVGSAPIYVNGYDVGRTINYPADLAQLFGSSFAEIEFVENTSDNYYDAVMVTVYEHGIVEDVYEKYEKIDFVGNYTVRFDSTDNMQVVKIIDRSGNKLSLSDIKPGDVLAMRVGNADVGLLSSGECKFTAAKNFADNGNVLTIINLGANTVSGTLNKYDDHSIYINNVRYVVGNFVDGNYDLVFNYGDEVKLGTTGTFYLDINNRIIGFDGKSGGFFEVGYILETEYSSINSSDKGWKVKILTQNGVEIYTLNYAFTIDDVDYRAENMTGKEKELTRYSSGNENYFKNNPSGNIVEYKLTSENKIKDIATVSDTGSLFERYVYNAETGKVGNYTLAKDATIFNLSSADIDESKVETTAELTNKGLYSGIVGNRRDYWNILAITDESSPEPSGEKTEDTKQLCVVVGLRRTLYNNFDAYEVMYYTDGSSEKRTAIFTDDSEMSGMMDYSIMKKGDIFVADIDESTGVVLNYTVLAQINRDYSRFIQPVNGAFAAAYGEDFTAKPGLDNGIDYIYGYIRNIYKRDGKVNIEICYDGNDSNVYTVSTDDSTNGYMYTNGKNAIITAGDWRGDYVDMPDYNNYSCTPIFVKLCDGVVTDVYSYNGRGNKFTGVASTN